jgi:hypothetical protein
MQLYFIYYASSTSWASYLKKEPIQSQRGSKRRQLLNRKIEATHKNNKVHHQEYARRIKLIHSDLFYISKKSFDYGIYGLVGACWGLMIIRQAIDRDFSMLPPLPD